MNKVVNNTVKFSLATLVVGIVITVIAVSLGGGLVKFGKNNTKTVEETYTGVESIEMNLDAADISVVIGNEFKISANNVSDRNFESYVENGKWYIKEKSNFHFFGFNNSASTIVVNIPESFNSENLVINLGAGKFSADKLSATNTNLTVGAGSLRINDLITDNLNVECGVGEIEIDGIVNNKGNVECGVGDVRLDLKGNEKDYNYNIDVGIGQIELNNETYSGIGNKFIDNKSADKEFTIENGIGHVRLNIK